MRQPLPLAALLAALLALSPTIAAACGIPFEARITYERALLVVDGPRQQLITNIALGDAAPDAAVLFPVPGDPDVDQPPGGDELFAYLEEATRPEIRREQRLVWGDGPDETVGGAPAGGVLIGRETIGGYDVAELAGDSVAVLAWLAENGYSVPPAAAPILEGYAAEGWRFVAVKLDDAAPSGSLAPLRISYTAERPLYPTRLDSLNPQPVALDLYVLTSGRVAVDALETAFAGPVAQLDPPPPPALAGLIDAPYLTRLRGAALDPGLLSADLLVAPAADDSPFREVVTLYEDVNILRRTGLIFGLFCTFALSSLALGLAIGMRRRIDAISPDPEAPPRRRPNDPKQR